MAVCPAKALITVEKQGVFCNFVFCFMALFNTKDIRMSSIVLYCYWTKTHFDVILFFFSASEKPSKSLSGILQIRTVHISQIFLSSNFYKIRYVFPISCMVPHRKVMHPKRHDHILLFAVLRKQLVCSFACFVFSDSTPASFRAGFVCHLRYPGQILKIGAVSFLLMEITSSEPSIPSVTYVLIVTGDNNRCHIQVRTYCFTCLTNLDGLFRSSQRLIHTLKNQLRAQCICNVSWSCRSPEAADTTRPMETISFASVSLRISYRICQLPEFQRSCSLRSQRQFDQFAFSTFVLVDSLHNAGTYVAISEVLF